jgi:hypothetical protein
MALLSQYGTEFGSKILAAMAFLPIGRGLIRFSLRLLQGSPGRSRQRHHAKHPFGKRLDGAAFASAIAACKYPRQVVIYRSGRECTQCRRWSALRPVFCPGLASAYRRS